MMKIKNTLPDDYTNNGIGDYMSELAQEKYELEKEQRLWELSKYTDSELQNELNERMFREFKESLNKLKNQIDNMIIPF